MSMNKLLIVLACNECSTYYNDEFVEDKVVEFVPIGDLSFNISSYAQYQEYECPVCSHRVSLYIQPIREVLN